MGLVIISDVHGQTFWKKIAERTSSSDTLVFLGDYFDRRGRGPWAESQIDNFLEICAFARKRPDTHLLVGNHDTQYMPWDVMMDGGVQPPDIQEALLSQLSLLKMVYVLEIFEPILCSHAGVTEDFLSVSGISSVHEINDCFKTTPGLFNFLEYYKGKWGERHGDNPWQSPLWVRPASLKKNAIPGFTQIVGHTFTESMAKEGAIIGDETVNDDPLWFTCTFSDAYLRVDDEGNFTTLHWDE